MSQDLFAAFGSSGAASNVGANAGSTSSLKQSTLSSDLFDSGHAGAITLSNEGIDDEDDFGDFEDASAEPAPVSEPPPATRGSGYPPPKASPVPPKANTATYPPPKASPVPPRPKKDQTRTDPKPAKGVGSHPFAGHMDFLFAADDDDYDAGADELNDLASNPEAAMAYSKRVIAEQQAEQERKAKLPFSRPKDVPPPPGPDAAPRRLQEKSGYASTKSPDVLFDADDLSEGPADEDGDDDFGDFEVSGTPQKAAPSAAAKQKSATLSMPAIDLLGLDDSPVGARATQAPQSKLSTSRPKATSAVGSGADRSDTPWQDDDWDDFEDSASSRTISSTTPKIPPELDSAFQRSTAAIAAKPKPSIDSQKLPPTNIPPPAILLSIFPSLFSSANDALFGQLSKLDVKQRQILLAHPATQTFLKGYLSLAIVLAHIIAGRRLRWKRDQYLAQGMRIGPAGAGGKGGMKLAGVDKGETAKEDREVLDAVSLWKSQVGKLRTAVTTASAIPGTAKLPSVPEIGEQMPVKTLKSAEGGMTAPHACALCGLKREERIAKVDLEADDSFGEWWVDGMSMHLLCKNFWEEHKSKLRSR